MVTEEEIIGQEGEDYIVNKLEEKGLIIFFPKNKFTISDRIILNPQKNTLYLAQFKRKDPMIKYPNYTGFSKKQFLKYKSEQEKYKLPMLILFVNKKMDKVYGEWLDNLENCSPMDLSNNKDGYLMVIWDIRKMKYMDELLA